MRELSESLHQPQELASHHRPHHPIVQAVVKMEVLAQKKIKVAINGFGRIGRNFLRCWEGRKDSLLDVVAINDSGGVKQSSHLLKYDTTLGTFPADVKIVDDHHISVNGKVIKVVSSRDPAQLPWKEMGIDLVIEGTGVFIDNAGAGKHIAVGARCLHPAALNCNCKLRGGSSKLSTPLDPDVAQFIVILTHALLPHPHAGWRQEGADHRPRQG